MRNYGYGKPRTKKVGKYSLRLEFHAFKKARFDIDLGNKRVYFYSSDTLSEKKDNVLERYRNLKNVKAIESFVKKRNAIK